MPYPVTVLSFLMTFPTGNQYLMVHSVDSCPSFPGISATWKIELVILVSGSATKALPRGVPSGKVEFFYVQIYILGGVCWICFGTVITFHLLLY